MCIVGCLMTDLFFISDWTGEANNFVFGLANKNVKAGVFSFARYDEDFWSEEKENPMKDKDWKTIVYRAIKVMTHEIGHMFGLKHCVYFECVMNGSNSEEENYAKP